MLEQGKAGTKEPPSLSIQTAPLNLPYKLPRRVRLRDGYSLLLAALLGRIKRSRISDWTKESGKGAAAEHRCLGPPHSRSSLAVLKQHDIRAIVYA